MPGISPYDLLAWLDSFGSEPFIKVVVFLCEEFSMGMADCMLQCTCVTSCNTVTSI